MLVSQQERDKPQTQEDPINVMAWMQLKGWAGCEKWHLFQCFKEFLRENYMHPDYNYIDYMNICIYVLYGVCLLFFLNRL